MEERLFKLENLVGKMVNDGATKYHYEKRPVLLTINDLGIGKKVDDEGFLSRLDAGNKDVYSFMGGDFMFTESDLNFVLGVK